MGARAKHLRVSEPDPIEESSGNVFQDLGFFDAAERLAKAELARVVRRIVLERNWTQRRAAAALGIAQPDVSDLMRGKLARFSQERLERFLIALDMDVRIQVAPRKPRAKRGRLRVELVETFGTVCGCSNRA